MNRNSYRNKKLLYFFTTENAQENKIVIDFKNSCDNLLQGNAVVVVILARKKKGRNALSRKCDNQSTEDFASFTQAIILVQMLLGREGKEEKYQKYMRLNYYYQQQQQQSRRYT